MRKIKTRFNFIKSSFYFSQFRTFVILLLEQNYCLCVYDIRTTPIPKELNFFDTNPAVLYLFDLPLGILLKELPIWDRSLSASLCIEVYSHKTTRNELLSFELPLLLFE